MKKSIKNFTLWSVATMALAAGLLVAPVQAQEALIVDTTIQAVTPAPLETGVAPEAKQDAATEDASIVAKDPTPEMLTGAERQRTFAQALDVSWKSFATIMLVMAAFGGLTALLTYLVPAKD